MLKPVLSITRHPRSDIREIPIFLQGAKRYKFIICVGGWVGVAGGATRLYKITPLSMSGGLFADTHIGCWIHPSHPSRPRLFLRAKHDNQDYS